MDRRDTVRKGRLSCLPKFLPPHLIFDRSSHGVIAMETSHFENALRLLPFGDQVGIVGSYALWEWLRKEDGVDSVGWQPGDVDVFVAGGTQAVFDMVVERYLDAARHAGIPLKIASKRAAIIDLEVDPDGESELEPTHLPDAAAGSRSAAALPPKPPAISFVRYRRADRIADIPDSFDIDICRVVLRVSPDGSRVQ